MSEKTRRKKDGHDTNKDRQAMREDVERRKELAAISRSSEGQASGDSTDQPDYTPYKRGSAEDRTKRVGGEPTGQGH